MKFKKILRAIKVVLLSMANMDYQMEFEKRKKPTLNVLEAFRRPALKEGQKENKDENGDYEVQSRARAN
jgi:hypothetical protein